SIGFLQACYLATQQIAAGKIETAVVATAEVDVHPDHPLGLQPSGGAVVLRPAAAENSGFGDFVFFNDLEHHDARHAVLALPDGGGFDAWIDVRSAGDANAVYAAAAAAVLDELLRRERLRWDEIAAVVPPQISPEFRRALEVRVPQLRTKLV